MNNLRTSLPLTKDTPTKIPEGTSAPSHQTGVATIPVIEAEEMVRHTVTKYLEKAGHRVLAVENGHEANDVWADRGTGIDLIIRSCRSACGRLTSAVATFF